MPEKRDFFISYTSKDEKWATWIAGVLEANHYTTIIQAWDFKAGENFVLNIHDALINCDRFIAVLSKAYFESLYCQAEWTSAFTKDPKSEKALFIPVRIEDVKPEGLFAPITYIDLCAYDEKQAKNILINSVSTKDRPRNRPGYPGTKRPCLPGELPFNNLSARNPHFTGRISLLGEIYQTFKEDKSITRAQAITGLGGIGKTEIVREYAFRHAQEYEFIWWVNAETENTILLTYSEFTQKIGFLDKEIKESKIIIEAVCNWMLQHDNWLFIFDNAENEKDLIPYLPVQNLGHRHILITSQNTIWERAISIHIDVFLPDEANYFLKKYTSLPQDKILPQLTKELGYLPLALEQAAAYINTHKVSNVEYLELFHMQKIKLLGKKPHDAFHITVTATFNISIAKIKDEGAKQLLNLIALFAPDKIHCSWFTKAAEYLPKPLSKVVNDKLDYNDVTAELTRYSLVKKDKNELSLHRLLQEVIKDSLQSKLADYIHYCVQILNELMKPDFSDPHLALTAEKSIDFLNFAPHVISVTDKINPEKQEEKAANLFFYLGIGHLHSADYPQAEKWLQKSSEIREKIFGEKHPETASTYNALAIIYWLQNKKEEAFNLLLNALRIFEKAGKENYIAHVCNNIGIIYRDQKQYDDAREWSQKALRINEKIWGKEHYKTATQYINIAGVHCRSRKYKEAMEWYQKGLPIREKELGEDHPDTASVYDNIGYIYKCQGQYDKALQWYQKALGTFEKVLGKEHPRTATTYYNIAWAYRSKCEYAEALEWHIKAFRVYIAKLGSEHPRTIGSKESLEFVYNQLHKDNSFAKWLSTILK